MFRMWKSALVLTGVVGIGLLAASPALRANGSAAPAPSGGGGSSMAPLTPEDMARDAYNSGIDHKNKGVKAEMDAEKQTKASDRDKALAKAKDEFGKALKDFEKATKLVPNIYQAYNGLGFAYRKTGDY